MRDKIDIKKEIIEGITNYLPKLKKFDKKINRAPIRKQILNNEDKKLSIKNALRYFPKKFHSVLAQEFLQELNKYGRIYMCRYRPNYDIKAMHSDDFPHKSNQASSVQLLICKNLDN